MRFQSKTEQKTRQRDLLFFTQPKLWPTWPFLAIVRRRPGQEEEYGVLFDAKTVCGQLGLSATVFLTNLFLMPPTLDEFLALPHETYDTAEEMADAGWVAD
jgi:hypothetical protein